MLIFRKLDQTIAGTYNGKPFNLPFTDDYLKTLTEVQDGTLEMDEETFFKLVESSHNVEVASKNKYLSCNPLTGEFFLTLNGVRHKTPLPGYIADTIIESADKGVDYMPILKAWARLLTNPRCNSKMIHYFQQYLSTDFIDQEQLQKLLDKGIERDAATQLATYQDLAITKEGLLATYKVAEKVTWKWIMKENEDGKYDKVMVDRYERIPAVLDPTTGKVITPETFKEPKYAEDYLFTPAIYSNGDDFYSGSDLGYVYQVGKMQRLPKNARRNLNNTFGGGGLYIGGLNYIDSYRSGDREVLTCFVDPADILSFQSEGQAIRVDALFVNNVWISEVKLKQIYHSSDYAKMSEARVEELISAAVNSKAVTDDVSFIEYQNKINEGRDAGTIDLIPADE